MIVSKLTSKSRTTIPQPVRLALGVSAGDDLAYAIENGPVILAKAPPRSTQKGNPCEHPFSTFNEWSPPEDQEAFADL